MLRISQREGYERGKAWTRGKGSWRRRCPCARACSSSGMIMSVFWRKRAGQLLCPENGRRMQERSQETGEDLHTRRERRVVAMEKERGRQTGNWFWRCSWYDLPMDREWRSSRRKLARVVLWFLAWATRYLQELFTRREDRRGMNWVADGHCFKWTVPWIGHIYWRKFVWIHSFLFPHLLIHISFKWNRNM